MSTRQIFSLLAAIMCATSVGCCAMHQGCGGMCGPSCGMCEPACCCPEPGCGCTDTCCEPGCGCPEPCCGCSDPCCEPACGCTDVCCGSGVGCCPILGNCWLIQRLRQACNRCYSYGGCCDGCSGEMYWNEWHNDPPCNCRSGGHAYTGGHYGGAYGRRAFLAKNHEKLTEELRMADGGSNSVYR